MRRSVGVYSDLASAELVATQLRGLGLQVVVTQSVARTQTAGSLGNEVWIENAEELSDPLVAQEYERILEGTAIPESMYAEIDAMPEVDHLMENPMDDTHILLTCWIAFLLLWPLWGPALRWLFSR